MSGISLLGSGNAAFQVDAEERFAASAEAGNYSTILTRAVSPQGLAGDAVFRRVYVTVEHRSGISIVVTPVVDGTSILENRVYFSRSPPSGKGPERISFMLPMGRTVRGRPGKVGVKGTTIQVEIAAVNPTGDWFVEALHIMYMTGHQSKTER